MRILVAEDERDMNRLISKRLAAENYSVDSCYDGIQVLEYLECAEYDGIILDIMMPRMDGIQVLKRIRGQNCQIPVLLLTARDSIEDRVCGLDAGADDYLVKPFAFEELLARIRVMLRKPASVKTNIYRVADLEVISQLLMLSRADQGRAKIIREQVDFSELTQMVVEEAQERAGEKNMTIQADIGEGLTLLGDEILLIRFWMNLLNNAIAYGKTGGTIQVSLKSWGEEIAGEIRDDGIGISQEALPHIWERFYQEDPSRTERESSGLGLPMVQWIVKEHGGVIQVSSKKGEGTCFYFSFPKIEKK